MKFRVGVIAKASDGNADTHRNTIKTESMEITTVVTNLSDFDQAIKTCQELAEQDINSIILTPDFTFQEVAAVSSAVEGKSGVFVARADIPSTLFVQQALIQGGWFPIGP
jgi:hypothetical protein